MLKQPDKQSYLALVAIVAVFFLLSRESQQQTRNYRSLEQEGGETDAPIARLWRSREQGKSSHVEYWFRFKDRTYAKQVKVPLRIWKTLQENGKLRVRFVPSNPEVNHPSDWEKPALDLGGVPGGGWPGGIPRVYRDGGSPAKQTAGGRQSGTRKRHEGSPGAPFPWRTRYDCSVTNFD